MPTEEATRVCRCGEEMKPLNGQTDIFVCWHCDFECEDLTKAETTNKKSKCQKCNRQLDVNAG